MESHTKKQKRKRVLLEDSTGIVATVEAKPERKKRRTEKNETRQILPDSTGDIPLQSGLGPPNDSECLQEHMEKQTPPKKAKKHNHRQVQSIVDEPVNIIENMEPSNDKMANVPQHRDVTATATVKLVQKILKKTHTPSTTDLHMDQLYDTIAKEKESSKHKERDREHVGSAADPISTPGEEKQHKKRKHKEIHSETARGISEPSKSLKLKKKRAKSLVEDVFPNPSEDTSLTGPALKALVYVYTRIASHSDWKFNKARQNWVIRNIWDVGAVPDVYFPSCVRYVADIRGNARDLLVKSGKSALDVKTVDKEKATEKDQGVVEGELSEEQLRQRQIRVKRAEMILAELGVDSGTEN